MYLRGRCDVRLFSQEATQLSKGSAGSLMGLSMASSCKVPPNACYKVIGGRGLVFERDSCFALLGRSPARLQSPCDMVRC